jgi:hypothetical protein
MPICAAATMNGSDVAWSSPIATAARPPRLRTWSSAGRPRITSRASRKTGTCISADGFSSSPRLRPPLPHGNNAVAVETGGATDQVDAVIP